MYSGQLIFSQLFEFVPRHEFSRCVARYDGNRRVRRFRCWDQFLVMAFAQLTFRESLRDIESCLRAVPQKLYHAGLKGSVARSTLAEANDTRDWRIWADFAAALIAEARRLHADDTFGAYETDLHPPEWELYNLDRDPFETVNLADHPEYATELKKLQNLLQDWQKETLDPLLDPAELQRLKKAHGL